MVMDDVSNGICCLRHTGSIVFTKGLSSLVEFRITRHDLYMHKREFSERVQGGRECNHFD